MDIKLGQEIQNVNIKLSQEIKNVDIKLDKEMKKVTQKSMGSSSTSRKLEPVP